jgi:archaellum component FlaC
MEVAALLFVAEAERKKKSGLFGGAVEDLVFLSKLYYPLWAIQWENSCLLIDGMETVSNNILYFKPPDAEAFVEHLRRSTTVQELYCSTLRSHVETFSSFTSQTEIPVEGFVADKELLSDILGFIKEAKAETNISPDFISLIEPKIGKEKAVKICKDIQEHYNKLQSEIKGLQLAINTVAEETKKHADKLSQEEEQMQERYEDQISNIRTEVEKRKKELEKERDEKIAKITATHEKEMDARLSERKKWEQELLRLEQNKSEYEKRKELRKRKNDEIGEARWTARLRDVQNQISTVKGKIKALSDFINRSVKETEKTTKNMHDTYQRLLDEEEKKITDLESLRDSELEKKRKEIAELKQESLNLTDKIEQLIEQKQERSSMLKEATIPWKTNTPTLIHLPFYLIQYEADKEKRHFVRPPVIARGHEGIVMKIRKIGTLLKPGPKINALLKSRSKALENIFASFEEKLESNKRIQKVVNQLGMSHNLLKSADFKEKVRKGMEELEVEGWIKPEEKEVILDIYVMT